MPRHPQTVSSAKPLARRLKLAGGVFSAQGESWLSRIRLPKALILYPSTRADKESNPTKPGTITKGEWL